MMDMLFLMFYWMDELFKDSVVLDVLLDDELFD